MSKISSDILGSLAYTEVKKMILSNELVPGEKIIQDRLALSLGISRTPLRTALQMLEAENLVESIPRRGMYVKKLSNKDIIDIYDCRMGFETTAVRLFTEQASDKLIEKLADIFTPFIGVETIDEKKYSKADLKFHNTIVERSNNYFLIDLFTKSNLVDFIDRVGLVRPPSETLPEHIEIIEAIKSRNVLKAEKASREHLIISRKLILKQLKNE